MVAANGLDAVDAQQMCVLTTRSDYQCYNMTFDGSTAPVAIQKPEDLSVYSSLARTNFADSVSRWLCETG